MNVKLSKRLQTVADFIPQGSCVADIGSDHALLPVYLVSQGIARYVIAGEVNPGPFEAARRQVKSAGLSHLIDVREGDGLEVITSVESEHSPTRVEHFQGNDEVPGERHTLAKIPQEQANLRFNQTANDDGHRIARQVDIITIAGMGGQLMTTILERGKEKLRGVKKLILQPNVGEESVRRWLVDRNWFLSSETIIEEDGFYYEILVAEREILTDMNRGDQKQHVIQVDRNIVLYRERQLANGCKISPAMLFMMGPYLIEQAEHIWAAKWHAEIAKLNMILTQLSYSQSIEAKQKTIEIQFQIEAMEEVLRCTQKVKPSFNG